MEDGPEKRALSYPPEMIGRVGLVAAHRSAWAWRRKRIEIKRPYSRRKKVKADRLWQGQNTPELSFALVDKDRNIMKFSMMTYGEAFRRNRTTKAFGFAWVRCDRRKK